MDDVTRRRSLRFAESKAEALFTAVVDRGLLAPGRTEGQVSDDVAALARERFGVTRFWHKRIVRSGPNTVEPYRANPPERTLGESDICFLDFGPLLADWEADYGRTYVLGGDPALHALADGVADIWDEAKSHFDECPNITGAELFEVVRGLLARGGWEHPMEHAGHLIGEFPHTRINPGDAGDYIAAGNTAPLRRLDAAGHPCHWILEVHAVDPVLGVGAFHEQLLDV